MVDGGDGTVDLFSVKCQQSPQLADVLCITTTVVCQGEILSLRLSVAPEAMEAADLYRTASCRLTTSILSSLFITKPTQLPYSLYLLPNPHSSISLCPGCRDPGLIPGCVIAFIAFIASLQLT